MAGLPAIRITPCKRTVIMLGAPAGLDIDHWPAAISIDDEFYFKPDASAILLSPADEEPSRASDARADELEVAIAVDRFMTTTDIEIKHVKHRWTGLRSFSSNRNPVVGYDPRIQGFFWLAAQGGYWIPTSPALSRLAAALHKEPILGDIAAEGMDIGRSGTILFSECVEADLKLRNAKTDK